MQPEHRPIAIAAFVFIALLATLTIITLVKTGPSVLTLVSLLVLSCLGFGIGGALREPPK